MDRWAFMDRRHMLKACGIAPIALASTAKSIAAAELSAVVVFDGREDISRQFAAAQSCARIDLVVEQTNGWQAIRAMHSVAQVQGLTRWGEFLLARSFFEEHGLRVTSNTIRTNGFTLWHMA
ncbi:hypothetical protein IP81_10425 [Novosphingobium sp. AAP83]|uniref:hypothetical protein n=1 Tax=Novosphingobium sp. AAP83 TaxID=1523425 RepID=UPI0006B95D4F|nr:hypothetical protein [Novosphingobium sp. AAP83]KPF91592.1 hypothetical protein IP81_10425 [Novosphingobium sp. AAP83]